MKSTKTLQVQQTNDSSVASKYSAVKLNYFDDEYLVHFVKEACRIRRSPLINRGYYIRAKAVSWAFNNFLTSNDGSPFQVLSLGAGFDTSFFRLRKDNNFCSACAIYCELDFVEVVRKKSAIIMATPCFKNSLEDVSCNEFNDKTTGIILNSKIYKLFGGNLEDLVSVEKTLISCGIDFNLPTFILSECSIVYLDPTRCDQLISFLGEKFRDATLAVYEQILPNDGFGKIMVRHFENRCSPLKCISRYPDPKSVARRYTNLGWDSSFCIGMSRLYADCVTTEEKLRLNSLEAFDEFEEFHSKCNHYVISFANKGPRTLNLFGDAALNISTERTQTLQNSLLLQPVRQVKQLRRFAHSSVVTKKGVVITFGGFGTSENQHKRLSTVHVFHIDSLKEHILQFEDVYTGGLMHHSALSGQDNTVMVFGGRNSPLKPSSELWEIEIGCQAFAGKESEYNLDKFHLRAKEIVVMGDIPCPRWRHGTCQFDKNGTQYVLLYGGLAHGSHTLGDTFILDTRELRWSKVYPEGEGPLPCHSHAMTLWKEKIIITGGLTANEEPLSTIYVLDYCSMKWTALNTPTIVPRYSHTCHIWNGYLLLVGGVNLSTESNPGLGVIDMETHSAWEIPLSEPDDAILLYNHTSVVNDDELIILGGGGNCFSFGTHFNYSAHKICLRSVMAQIKST